MQLCSQTRPIKPAAAATRAGSTKTSCCWNTWLPTARSRRRRFVSAPRPASGVVPATPQITRRPTKTHRQSINLGTCDHSFVSLCQLRVPGEPAALPPTNAASVTFVNIFILGSHLLLKCYRQDRGACRHRFECKWYSQC